MNLDDLTREVDQALEELRQLRSRSDVEPGELVERAKADFLARKGRIAGLFKGLKELSADERPEGGRRIHALREAVDSAIESWTSADGAEPAGRSGRAVRTDVTLPGIRRVAGGAHPISQTMEDMLAIFDSLGFSFRDYPAVETEEYNFDALNTPSWHPARDMHDSFYLTDGRVLRTHTSAFQVRAMELAENDSGNGVIREVTTGRCFRNDPIDASHSPVFHQFDGISIGEHVTFAELKWTLSEMTHRLFGADTDVRFRPSFFPFTTPSAEVDISCVLCGGSGCGYCKRSGWVEILGCGMIRPEVLRAGGIDPGKRRGFAFGIGVDRVTSLRWGIPDIRLFFENDVLFLSQF